MPIIKILSAVAVMAFLCNSQAYSETFTVKRVIDGKTLEISSGQTVQLIGVDAPSFTDLRSNNSNAKKHAISPQVVNRFARRSRDYVTRKVKGKKVILEVDESYEAVGHKDREGHLLAYVYLADELPEEMISRERHIHGHFEKLDGELPHFHLNASIVKYGYGFADESVEYSRKGDFQRFEYLARRNQRGLWREGR